ncbi:MAG: protein kinase domain-containing protein [Terriglobales bacterium]
MDASRKIGPFELLERLGAGGMGEVFKARDTRLNRLVALKFLPGDASTAARERFHREAMAIAALNHPHICTLHETGDDRGQPFLVLELLEGETLKARLGRGPLNVETLLDWAAQIADALDAAHRKGVLHRDLKPENIWVAPGGHIKVLDFGLARLEEETSDEAPTMTAPLTSPGATLGTAPYMSPEQVRGQPLDARSDLFSFGCVLYEMTCRRRAFAAGNSAEVMAAILRGQPEKLRTLRPDAPAKLEEIVERCLEKDPELRYQSAADLRSDLKRLRRESGSASSVSAPPAAEAPRPAGRRWWRWAGVAVIVIAVAALAWQLFRPQPGAAPTPQLTFRQLTFSGRIVAAALSPLGNFLAHVDATPQGDALHLLSVVSGSDVQIVPPGNGCCSAPAFSPDGGSIYFNSGGAIDAVPVLGGAVRTIAAGTGCESGVAFSPDGSRIAYFQHTPGTDQLLLAHTDGSGARVLASPATGDGFDASGCWTNYVTPDAPAWSPDGRWIAVILSGEVPVGRIRLIDAKSGQGRDLGPVLRAANPASPGRPMGARCCSPPESTELPRRNYGA